MCTYVYLSIKRDVCVPVERSDPATMQSGRKMKSQSPGPTPESQLLVLPQVFRKKTNSARIDACYFKISKILLHFPCKYSITIDTSVSLFSWLFNAALRSCRHFLCARYWWVLRLCPAVAVKVAVRRYTSVCVPMAHISTGGLPGKGSASF